MNMYYFCSFKKITTVALKMKLELTLEGELTGIGLSFLFFSHPSGLGQRQKSPRGLHTSLVPH